MSRSKPNPWLIVAIVGSTAYPLMIYFFHAVIPSIVWVFLGLALIGLRLLGLRDAKDMGLWRGAFLFAAAGIIGVMLLDAHLAALIYPVMISLSVAAIFGLSLLFPPSLVERIARRREPDLNQQGVRYTKRVTQIWFVFLLSNASISAGTAIWGTVAEWTLWNGLISYLLMGLLFAGEMIWRRKVRS